MALTLQNLRDVISSRLGSTLADATLDMIVNEAGRLMTIMHPWAYLERPPASLDFTISVAFVALPSDFGQLLSYSYVNSNGLFQFTDFAGLLALRAQTISSAGVFWGAIVSPTQAGVTLVPPVQRIELVPTPTVTLASALTIVYRARWTELSAVTDVANIPWYMDSLLRELCGAIGLGYTEHDDGTVDQRLDSIRKGTLYEMAMRYDSMAQPDYGILHGGAIEAVQPRGYIPFNSVADPS